ncbi:MAG TPA: carbohydrate kinase family protein [bacterium]|nr:carbohydrate kinase family protein [bacterium]HPQ19525.1 carbohydrate kinase family protein [bacterium]
MKKILVSGLIDLEITLNINEFPIYYSPIEYLFNKINCSISGVGFNVAKALKILGADVSFLSIIGNDFTKEIIFNELKKLNIPGNYVLPIIKNSAQSIIMYDKRGERKIYVDLKDIQTQNYPIDKFEEAIKDCEIAILCNINFSRVLLKKAKEIKIPIATDVHTIASLDDEYNYDFLQSANILFMSNEYIKEDLKVWAKKIFNKFSTEILVIGCGKQGALLSVRKDNFIEFIPAKKPKQIINTIGAGDILFSTFIYYYQKTKDPYIAIEKAQFHSAYKIGWNGGAEGFLSEEELEQFIKNVN